MLLQGQKGFFFFLRSKELKQSSKNAHAAMRTLATPTLGESSSRKIWTNLGDRATLLYGRGREVRNDHNAQILTILPS